MNQFEKDLKHLTDEQEILNNVHNLWEDIWVHEMRPDKIVEAEIKLESVRQDLADNMENIENYCNLISSIKKGKLFINSNDKSFSITNIKHYGK